MGLDVINQSIANDNINNNHKDDQILNSERIHLNNAISPREVEEKIEKHIDEDKQKENDIEKDLEDQNQKTNQNQDKNQGEFGKENDNDVNGGVRVAEEE